MDVHRLLGATTVLLAVLGVCAAARQAEPPQPAGRPTRTWRAGSIDPARPGPADRRPDVCAALASVDGSDLWVAVSRGDAKSGDVLLHLACGNRGVSMSRAALLAMATSGEPGDVEALFDLAAQSDPVRSSLAVEALLLAGIPVDTEMVARAYRLGDAETRRRLLVAMSAAAAVDALRAAAAEEPDEMLARDARRRLEALR